MFRPLTSLPNNICLCNAVPGQVLGSQRLIGFKREHKLFWSRVTNCDTKDWLVKKFLPDCHVIVTSVFNYFLSVKHERRRRKVEDRKATRRQCFVFYIKSNPQAITPIKNLKKLQTL